MSGKSRPTDQEIAERFHLPKAQQVQAEVLARIRAGNPMSFEEMAEALDVPVDVVVDGFARAAAKTGVHDMPEKYLSTDQASREMDFAMLDCIEKHFHDPGVADTVRAGMAAGKPMPRMTELAKVLNTSLDELLKAFLKEVYDRTGITYELHGLMFKARAN